MSRHQTPSRLSVQSAAYREAFQRLDEALVENTSSDNRERIRLMREVYSADVEALKKSRTVKIPE